MQITLEFNPHKYQDKVLASKKEIIAVVAGKRAGKTTIGAIWFIGEIIEDIQKGIVGEYLIIAPSYKILQQATLRTFLKYWNPVNGIYKKGDSKIDLINGGVIWIRSVDDPNAIEGLTARRIWADEAGMMKREVWDKLLQRLTQVKGQAAGRAILTTTPYGGLATSWLNLELIEKRKELPWLEYINFSTADNKYIDSLIFERAKQTMNPQLFQRDYLGLFVKLTGLIYDQFDREIDVVAPFDITGVKAIGGMDYGFTDPTVILILKKKDNIFYVIDEFYKSESRMDEQADFIKKYKTDLKQILYDPSAVGWCKELRRFGQLPLNEANNEVEAGIARVYRLIKEHRLKVFNTCENTIRELESYVYSDKKNVPSHDNSHSPDALRYAFSKDLLGVYPELELKKPVVFREKTVEDPLQLRTQVTSDTSPDAWSYEPITNPDTID